MPKSIRSILENDSYAHTCVSDRVCARAFVCMCVDEPELPNKLITGI